FNDAEELIDAIVCSFDISIVPLDVDHPNFKELAKNEQNIINDRLNELADKIKRYNDIISMHNPGSVKRIAAKSMMSFIEDEKQRLNQELASLQKQGEA
ncbi:hypothetical protein KDA11_02955, partial [Candidatus Saccharibacteria bacterium]|nr:hypothetical protein [Candidatus Saccharibacteria bacterium]